MLDRLGTAVKDDSQCVAGPGSASLSAGADQTVIGGFAENGNHGETESGDVVRPCGGRQPRQTLVHMSVGQSTISML